MRVVSCLLGLLAVVPAGAALACEPLPAPPDPRPLQQLLDESARFTFGRAAAMVEVVAVKSSGYERPGTVRVVRSLKGPIRPGRRLRLRSVDGAACGAGHFERGERGLILIDRLEGPLLFQGWLPGD